MQRYDPYFQGGKHPSDSVLTALSRNTTVSPQVLSYLTQSALRDTFLHVQSRRIAFWLAIFMRDKVAS